jgi:hypothetical protein
MPSVSERLIVVRECVEVLWASRSDGRWAALESALIAVIEPEKAPERRKTQRRSNVILLSDYLERRRLADRRTRKPP